MSEFERETATANEAQANEVQANEAQANEAQANEAQANQWLLSFEQATSTARVGPKAARQAELAKAGYAVPPACVVTTAAYSAHRSAKTPEELDAAFVASLQAAADEVGYPVAVRSSAVAEDLEDASFAGMYATILDVQDGQELVEAVLRCWESASSAHLFDYMDTRVDGAQDLPMAVIIQRMVPADFAGVAFSADPRTGDRSQVVIEAVAGLGEKLVSGGVNAQRWRMRGNALQCETQNQEGLSEAQAREVADLARQVATQMGEPQDIEWAIANGELLLLQARPITTLPDVEPVEMAVEPPPGSWTRSDNHFSAPPSPLFTSIFEPNFREAGRKAFGEFGMPMGEDFIHTTIGGWFYIGADTDKQKPPPMPPAWLIGVLAHIIPSLRSAAKNAKTYLSRGQDTVYIDKWWNEWRPSMERRVEQLDAVDRRSLSDRDLADHVEECVQIWEEMWDIHLRLSPPDTLATAELSFFCEEVLGWDARQTIDLVSGLSRTTSEPSRRLSELARRMRDNPEAMELVDENPPDALPRLEQVAPELFDALAQHQSKYGLRTVEHDILSPTMRERPQWTWNLLRGQLHTEVSAEDACARGEQARLEAVERARQALTSDEDRRRFEHRLARAQKAYPVREDNSFWLSCAAGLMRVAFLEVGRRMKKRGHARRDDDVMFLSLDEVRQWLDEPVDDSDHSNRIDHRRGQWLWAKANRPPARFGQKMQFPGTRYLPKAMRRVLDAMIWSMEHAEEPAPEDGEALKGTPVSNGTHTGTVRIVHDSNDFWRVRPGDVLVCRTTTPAWSALFSQIGALVTEAGGLLSHPAIVAREFDLPGVLGVRDATTLLRDGQVVTVDGETGTVSMSDIDHGAI